MPFDDLARAAEVQLLDSPRRLAAAGACAIALVATWWVYVPIHELLHALGCWLTGGTVTELQIAPVYGGALLARVFPFVVAEGDYAGRLSGFDTHGSDLVYLATDALPYVLTILVGVPLLKSSAQPARELRFGSSLPLALAPLYSLAGDYYEMGSIVTTRVLSMIGGAPVLARLRSDDLLRLTCDLWSRPEELGASTGLAVSFVVVIISLAVGTLLAFATYYIGHVLYVRFGSERR